MFHNAPPFLAYSRQYLFHPLLTWSFRLHFHSRVTCCYFTCFVAWRGDCCTWFLLYQIFPITSFLPGHHIRHYSISTNTQISTRPIIPQVISDFQWELCKNPTVNHAPVGEKECGCGSVCVLGEHWLELLADRFLLLLLLLRPKLFVNKTKDFWGAVVYFPK